MIDRKFQIRPSLCYGCASSSRFPSCRNRVWGILPTTTKKWLILTLVFGIALVISTSITSAEDDWYSSKEHEGSYCAGCHIKHSDNSIIIEMFPCAKRECHAGVTPIGRNSVSEYHMTLCGECHESLQKVDDIYTTLQSTHQLHKPYGVNCTNCHTSTGYDSEIVHVSVNETGDPYHQDPSCPSCHSLGGDRRDNLHGIHGAILNKACISCHGEIANITQQEMNEMFDVNPDFYTKQSSDATISGFLNIFFNQIAVKMHNIVDDYLQQP